MAGTSDATDESNLEGLTFNPEGFLDMIGDHVYVIDSQENLVHWNDRFLKDVGYGADDAASLSRSDFFAPYYLPENRGSRNGMEPTDESALVYGHLITGAGQLLPCEIREHPVRNQSGDLIGWCGTGRIFETSHPHTDAFDDSIDPNHVIAVDTDKRIQYVSGETTLFDHSGADQIGATISETREAHGEEYMPCLDRVAAAIDNQHPESDTIYHEHLERWLAIRIIPSHAGVTIYCEDITEQQEREDELKKAKRRFDAVFNSPFTFFGIADDEGRVVHANDLAMNAITTPKDEVRGIPLWETEWWEYMQVEPEQAKRVVEQVRDGRSKRFKTDATLPGNVEMSIDAVARPVYNDDDEVVAIQFQARDISNLLEKEKLLEEQKEKLEQLNRINSVIRETIQGIIRASTRTELERTVCETLTKVSPYKFVWVGELNLSESTIEPQTWAGEPDNYLDGVIIPTDETGLSQGPAGQAIRSGELQVVEEVAEYDGFEPWREKALGSGFQSAVAIPLTYQSSTYGVLGLYAEDGDGFNREERTVLKELGDTIGYALHLGDRDKTTVGETEIELELLFELPVLTDSLTPGQQGVFTPSAIEKENTMALYGYLEGVDQATFEEIINDLTSIVSFTKINDNDSSDTDQHKYEILLEVPELLSTLKRANAEIKKIAVQHDGIYFTLTAPDTEAAQTAVKGLREIAHGVEILSQQTHRPRGKTATEYQSLMQQSLTDRQRTVLKTAYLAGYFEHPRDMNGNDIAESLDISGATFRQHLRAAQRKIFQAVYA